MAQDGSSSVAATASAMVPTMPPAAAAPRFERLPDPRVERRRQRQFFHLRVPALKPSQVSSVLTPELIAALSMRPKVRTLDASRCIRRALCELLRVSSVDEGAPLLDLASGAQLLAPTPGTVLARTGAPLDSFFYVLRGSLESHSLKAGSAVPVVSRHVAGSGLCMEAMLEADPLSSPFDLCVPNISSSNGGATVTTAATTTTINTAATATDATTATDNDMSAAATLLLVLPRQVVLDCDHAEKCRVVATTFPELDPSRIPWVAGLLDWCVRAGPSVPIFRQGDIGDTLHLLLHGTADVLQTRHLPSTHCDNTGEGGGRRGGRDVGGNGGSGRNSLPATVCIERLRPPAYFGEIALLNRGRQPVSVVTVGPVSTYAMSFSNFVEAFETIDGFVLRKRLLAGLDRYPSGAAVARAYLRDARQQHHREYTRAEVQDAAVVARDVLARSRVHGDRVPPLVRPDIPREPRLPDSPPPPRKGAAAEEYLKAEVPLSAPDSLLKWDDNRATTGACGTDAGIPGSAGDDKQHSQHIVVAPEDFLSMLYPVLEGMRPDLMDTFSDATVNPDALLKRVLRRAGHLSRKRMLHLMDQLEAAGWDWRAAVIDAATSATSVEREVL